MQSGRRCGQAPIGMEKELQDLKAFINKIGVQLISRGRGVEGRPERAMRVMDSGFESVTEPESDDDDNITVQ